MIIKLDMSNSTPIYIQLRNAIVKGIGNGELLPNESLPTVRQMAEDLGINTMTVNKSYSLLKAEGFIEVDRRHGAKVKKVFQPSKEFEEKLEQNLELLIAESVIKGVNKENFLKTCLDIFKDMKYINKLESDLK